jgi:hypothetical protein
MVKGCSEVVVGERDTRVMFIFVPLGFDAESCPLTENYVDAVKASFALPWSHIYIQTTQGVESHISFVTMDIR